MPTKPKPMKTNSGDFMFTAGLVTVIGGTFAIAMFAIMSTPAQPRLNVAAKDWDTFKVRYDVCVSESAFSARQYCAAVAATLAAARIIRGDDRP